MSERDYAKPVGWWCNGCGCAVGGWGCYEHSLGEQCPIFAPLPTPEPGADEPDEDTVCVSLARDVFRRDRGRNRRAIRSIVQERWWAVEVSGMVEEPLESLADAVLWVTEGRLPGSER